MDKRIFSYEVGGGSYSISDRVVLPKSIETVCLSIEGWSNRRLLLINKENNVSYFQASAEGTECYRCSICQRRMKLIGCKTDHDFVEIEGYYSLYQRIEGIPKDISPDVLRQFLSLPVVG